MAYLIDVLTLGLIAAFVTALGFVPYYVVADGSRTFPGCFAILLGALSIATAVMIAPYGHFVGGLF